MAGEIARIPVEAAKRPKRSWDESFFLRFPRLLHLLYRRLTRRGPRSRLRRAVLVQSQLAGWEATNREDWDVNLIAFHPAYEFVFEGDDPKIGIDIGTRHVGREGVVAMIDTWRSGFEDLRFEPREILDPGGERFGARVVQLGRASEGIEVSQELWTVYRLQGGLIVRQTIYFDEESALEALAEPPSED